MPAWPRLLYRYPQAADQAMQDIIDWLTDTAVTAGDTACTLCTVNPREDTLGLCGSCYRKAARVEDYLYLLARGIQDEDAARRIGEKQTPRTIERDLANLRALTGQSLSAAA
jgi:hypothetical protein